MGEAGGYVSLGTPLPYGSFKNMFVEEGRGVVIESEQKRTRRGGGGGWAGS